MNFRPKSIQLPKLSGNRIKIYDLSAVNPIDFV